MATAADYNINFGYGAQDGYFYGPTGKVGKYHRGNDRPCPTGTPIVIGQYTIGWTGSTGIVSGPHLHTQACTAGRQWADDLNPSIAEFKYGTVVQAGWHNQFGNYVMIRVGGIDITYAHLSKINVSANQILAAPSAPATQGDNEVANRDQANLLYNAILFRAGDEGGLNNYTGKNANLIASEMFSSQERKSLEAQINGNRDNVNNLQNIVNQQNQAIANLTAKLQSSDATASEKTSALNKALVDLQNSTNELLTVKNKLQVLEATKAKSVEAAVASNQPKPINSAPNQFFRILLNLLVKLRK